MIPAMCRVSHKPDEGQYGDCVRAALATILDLDTENVPHFAHDNPTGTELLRRMREWLTARGETICGIAYPDTDMTDLLAYMGEQNPDAPYLLFGTIAEGGSHVVVCRGGKVVHNPAWYGCSLVGPTVDGYWTVMVVVRL